MSSFIGGPKTGQEFRERFIDHWGSRIAESLKARLTYACEKVERIDVEENHVGWCTVRLENLDRYLVVHTNAINKTKVKAGDEVRCLYDPNNNTLWYVEKASMATVTGKEVEEAYGQGSG